MRTMQKHGWILLLLSALFLCLFLGGAQAEGGRVSGLVWLDKTPDGEISGGEGGFANARVILEGTDANGEAVMVNDTLTPKSGDYLFEDVPAGTYRLRVELPSDTRFSLHGGASDALPAQGGISYTPYFTVQDGQSAVLNIGVTKANTAVSFIAFEDVNANGGRMSSEPVIRGARVDLLYTYEGESYVVASGITDKQGQLALRELSPATYTARVTLPDHFVIGPTGQKINSFYNCFLANDDNTGYTEPFFVEAKETAGLGIGAVRTGALAGRIWFDANYNGKWDKDEAGLTDATITLYSPALGLSRSTQANAGGDYSFTSLQPGDYRLEFALPEGMVFTYSGASLLSDISSTGSLNVSVQVDVTTSLGPVGAMPAATMALTLYRDDNLNGVRDAEEPGLSGASVSAAQNGKTAAQVTSDENGVARFTALRGGDTVLKVQLPEGYLFSVDEANLFSIPGARTETETALTLDGAQPEAQFAAAVTVPASVSGMLFEDPDNTGIYRESNARLSGFTVQAVDENGYAVLETVTDENGEYTLSPLLPGTYTVRFLLDDAYVASPFAAEEADVANHIRTQNPDYGETEPMQLLPGQTAQAVDGSVFRAGVVGGRVLLKESRDAEAQGGLAGVTVTLLSPSGAPVSAHSYGVTEEDGSFLIKGVLPGTYTLLYTMPDNGAFIDPDTASFEYESEPITAVSGSEIHMPDLAGVYTSSLSGSVLGDDGQPVSARFSLAALDGGNEYEAVTKSDGSYLFSGLRPGAYELTVTLPEGLVFASLPESVIPAYAGNCQVMPLRFAMRQDLLDADIHAAAPVTLSGTVFYDVNLSGAMDEEEYGAEERTLVLQGSVTEPLSLTADAEGHFTAENLVPGEYALSLEVDENEILTGDLFTQEADGGPWMGTVDLQQDAVIQVPLMRFSSIEGSVWSLDGSDQGVGGIEVQLLNENGQAAQAVTDDQGAFAFSGLVPGTYSLSAVLPQGYLFAREQDTHSRDSLILSLPDGTPQSVPFTVPMGDELSGMDIGMGAMGAIGDRGWLDTNGNGMQDAGEPNVPGIRIELYQHGELIASTVTDVYGHYKLSSLYPGEYDMQVTMPSELKTTVCQTEFPLLASVLPESKETTVAVPGVVVPSGGQNLHCDLGFQLRKQGVYPAEMSAIPTKDWTPYNQR